MTEQKLRGNSGSKESDCIRILLADDHKILRTGLRSLIERQPRFKVVAEAEQGETAVRLCRELSPDVVLMDISMPDLNGVEATRHIIRDSPKTKIVILSVHSGHRFVADVFGAGASGYLLKNCSFEEVVDAILTVSAGGTYLCPKIATIIRKDYIQCLIGQKAKLSSLLTSREREVLQLISEGKNTKEIAFALNLSSKTVEAHRRRIMDKLGIHSIAALTKYAIREGLTSEEL